MMNNQFEDNKLDLYFYDADLDKDVRRRYNNIIENPSGGQISGFARAIANLTDLISTHSILVTSTKYVNA